MKIFRARWIYDGGEFLQVDTDESGVDMSREFPRYHFRVPWWAALFLAVSNAIARRAERLIRKWRPS